MSRRVLDGALFDFRDAAWHGDDHAWPHHSPAIVHLADKVPEHGFGHLEVRDHAVLKRTNGHNVARSAAQHTFGLVADGEHFVRAVLNGNYGGFAEHDAVILDIDEGIGSPQIDADIVRKKS